MLFSIHQFSFVCHLESFPNCIAHYWFMASSAQKMFRKWIPMNFRGIKKLSMIVTGGFL